MAVIFLVKVRELVSSVDSRSVVVFLPGVINIGPLFYKILTSKFLDLRTG
jgi:hypothetical protein